MISRFLSDSLFCVTQPNAQKVVLTVIVLGRGEERGKEEQQHGGELCCFPVSLCKVSLMFCRGFWEGQSNTAVLTAGVEVKTESSGCAALDQYRYK